MSVMNWRVWPKEDWVVVPFVVLADGAHNPVSIKTLGDYITLMCELSSATKTHLHLQCVWERSLRAGLTNRFKLKPGLMVNALHFWFRLKG